MILLLIVMLLYPAQTNPLANVKKIDCSLLPPSRRSLEMHLLRARYVTIIWLNASSACPAEGLSPTDYRWIVNDKLLQPNWFDGPAIPDSLFTDETEDVTEENVVSGDEPDSDAESSDDEPWSEDSDDLDCDD